MERPQPDFCPFCGHDQLRAFAFADVGNRVQMAIQCQGCEAIGPIGDPADNPLDAEFSAIGKWNARGIVQGSSQEEPVNGTPARRPPFSPRIIITG